MRDNKKRNLEDRLKDLDFRLALVKKCICTIEEEHNDPRAPEALEHYKAQLAEIEQRIAETRAALSGPCDVIIGLQSARLFAKRG